MTSRAGATKAQMAPLCRDSQQLWREAGPLLQQLEPPALALGTFIQEEPTGQSRVSLGTVTWHFIPATVWTLCRKISRLSVVERALQICRLTQGKGLLQAQRVWGASATCTQASENVLPAEKARLAHGFTRTFH